MSINCVRASFVGLLVGLLAPFVAPETTAATDYYVRKTGNDGSSGTSAANAWRTMDKAAAVASAGDRVFVGAGTYTESVGGLQDGTAADPVIWVADKTGAYTGDSGSVRVRSLDGGTFALRLTNEYHIIFYRFDFTSNPNAATADGIWMPNSGGIIFAECTFSGFESGIDAESSELTVYQCAFTDCRVAVSAVSGSDVTMSGSSVNARVGGGYTGGVYAEDSAVDVDGCTFVNGSGGIYQESGTGFSFVNSTVTGTSMVGLWVEGTSVYIEGSEIADAQYCVYLPAGGGSQPQVRNSVIRDGVVGIYHGWHDMVLRTLTLSGHSDAGIRVIDTTPSYSCGSEDTVTVTGCRYGLAWNGDPGVTQSLTVDTKTWTDNEDHVWTDDVETVVARNLNLSGGHGGVQAFDADSVTVTNGTFADGDAIGNTETRAAVLAETAAATVTDCTMDRWYYGVHLTGAADPDLRRLIIRDSDRDGISLRGGFWNWQASDAITLSGNWIGAYASGTAWTIDGGASGIAVTGAPGTGFGVFAVGGSTDWRNVHVADSDVGFRAERSPGTVIEDCSSTNCSSWGVQIIRDAADADAVAATVSNFAGSECTGGLNYDGNGATTQAVALSNVAFTRTASYDADGVPTNAAGDAFLLGYTPIDPALQTGLSAAGYQWGLNLWWADATVTAASSFDFSGCGTGIQVTGGALSVTGVTMRQNDLALSADGSGGSHAIALSNCDLWGGNLAIRFSDHGGAFDAANCTFASRDDDAIRFSGGSGAAVAVTFTDCDVAGAGDDGYEIAGHSARGGTVRFERCTATNAADDGVKSADLDATLIDCAATASGDVAFFLTRDAAVVSRCVANGARTGFRFTNCSTGTLDRCGAYQCTEDGVLVSSTGGNYTLQNLLVVGGADGVQVEGSGGTAVVRHLTAVVSDDCVRAVGRDLTVQNSVLVGAFGADAQTAAAGAALILDHVLIDAPTPYAGDAVAGPDDLLKPPLFEDAANGDYTPAMGSPMINAGTDLAGIVDLDLQGLARPTFDKYELGAYESPYADSGVRILDWKESAH